MTEIFFVVPEKELERRSLLNLWNLLFEDNTFDIVTSHTLLGILQKPRACILEKKRVAKIGGSFCC
ncbi:MAG: methyltransferase domain-containing protein [Candidatus Bathyarchaeia archaeon]